MYRYLLQESCWPIGKGFIKMFDPQSILERSPEHFQVGVDDLDSRLIKVDEIFSQRFKKALANVNETGGIHLLVFECCILMDQFLL